MSAFSLRITWSARVDFERAALRNRPQSSEGSRFANSSADTHDDAGGAPDCLVCDNTGRVIDETTGDEECCNACRARWHLMSPDALRVEHDALCERECDHHEIKHCQCYLALVWYAASQRQTGHL